MKKIIFNSIFIIFAIFLGVMLFRSLLMVDTPLTFSNFLYYLEVWDNNFKLNNIFGRNLISAISGDWGAVDFLRIFINDFLIEVVNVFLWLCGALIQVVVFICKTFSFLISF